ncbi:MAG: HlyC/CorC family transporter [Candidatus Omnitrophica bacterium]|nr:HlyC/CorC family transporter [Candidatus Omnitrophota bacterium]
MVFMDAKAVNILPVILFVLLIFSAFFSMSEVAFVGLNKLRLRYLVKKKIFAVKHTEKVALEVAWLMELIMKILEPAVKILLSISNNVLKGLGQPSPKRSPLVSEEEIRLMIELGKEEGVLSDGERTMLHRIFEFGDTLVYEVMNKREKIVAIEINATPEELLNTIVEEGHSRIPVYEGNLNNIKGVIYARELLNIWRNQDLIILGDLLHQPYFVSSKIRVSELLRQFQKNRIYMAIVIDENKNTLGLVTLEDLLEEIVGEIEGDISL